MAKPANRWLWLTAPIGALLAIATGMGLFVPGLYRDSPYFATQAVAQDLITLAVGLPLLVITAALAARGSLRARSLWLGALIYVVYTYAIAALDVRFNALFLVYVALLGCSLYALIGGLVTTDLGEIKASFGEHTPRKTVSLYLGILAILFYGLWLSEIIPALAIGAIPQSVLDNGTPTNAVHVLDMAWVLPAMGIAAVSLWRQRPLGYTLAGALLAFVALLALAILSMVEFLARGGYAVAAPQAVVFGVLFLLSLGMLTWYMKRSSPTSRNPVQIANIIPQLRTTDLAASIDFYTTQLGFTLEFQHEGFYAGVRGGGNVVHLKLIDETDPSIAFVDHGEHFHLYLETDDVAAAAERLRRAGVRLERDVHETTWGTRELIIRDDQGHTLYLGQRVP